MLVVSWNSWSRLAVAACTLLGVVACAPNSARTPLEPRLAAATDGEREQGRYGTLLRLAASARAGGDLAAAVRLYQQAITNDRSRIDAYVLLGDTLIDMGRSTMPPPPIRRRSGAIGRIARRTGAMLGRCWV